MAWPQGIPNWLKNQWGVISGQVSERATTSELINALRPYAQASPEGWGPLGVIYVSQLRSLAVSIRNSSEAITAQGMTGTITAAHIAEAPWARSAVQQSLAPKFMLRALVQYPNPEALAGIEGAPPIIEDWITQWTSNLPGTFEQLTQQIMQTARDTGSPPAPVTAISKLEMLRE